MFFFSNQRRKLSEELFGQGAGTIFAQNNHKYCRIFFACPAKSSLNNIQVFDRQRAKSIMRTLAKQDKIELVKIFHGKNMVD